MPLKVLFVASEAAPFRKTGGLADVAGALPRALRRRGIDVRVVMPLYGGINWNALEILDGSLSVPVYFLEYHRFFDRPFLYGPPGQAYSDNLERFAFFSRGALELCKALGFQPD